MQPGGHLGDVGAAIDAVVDGAGYGSPRDYCGHGIGRAMHEDPDVENRGRRGKGPRLEPGVVLAIEPMLIAGGRDDVEVLDDDWTVVTADGSLAAHTEHTVVVVHPILASHRYDTSRRLVLPKLPAVDDDVPCWPDSGLRMVSLRQPLFPTPSRPWLRARSSSGRDLRTWPTDDADVRRAPERLILSSCDCFR